MLADISNVDAIYIVCGKTDMRKSIDSLCAIIQEKFSMNLTEAIPKGKELDYAQPAVQGVMYINHLFRLEEKIKKNI